MSFYKNTFNHRDFLNTGSLFIVSIAAAENLTGKEYFDT